jgi:Flp pilus assembly protein TadD
MKPTLKKDNVMSDDRRLDELDFDSDPHHPKGDLMDISSDMLDLDQEIETLKAKKLIDADDMSDDEDFLKEPARPVRRRSTFPKSAVGLVAVLGVLGGGYVLYGDQIASLMSQSTSSPAPASVASYPPETSAPVSSEEPVSAPVVVMPDSSAPADPAMVAIDHSAADKETPPVPGTVLAVPVPPQDGLSVPSSAADSAAAGTTPLPSIAQPEAVEMTQSSSPPDIQMSPVSADSPSERPTQADMTTVVTADVPPQPEIMENEAALEVSSAVPAERKKTQAMDAPVSRDVVPSKKDNAAPVADVSVPKPDVKQTAPVKELSETTEKPVQKLVQEKESKTPAIQKEPQQPVLDDLATEKEEDMAPLAPPPVPASQIDEYADAGDGLDALNEQGATRSGLKLTKQQKQSNLGVRMSDRVQSANPQARIESAFRALDLERYEAANDMFSNLVREYPRDERALMGQAVALQKLGRDAESARVYEQLLSVNPDNVSAMTNYLGLMRKQNPSAAIRRLSEMMAKYPRNGTLAAQTGLAYAGAGSYTDALRYLNYAATLEPGNPGHYYNLAIVAERMNNTVLAIKNYEKALDVSSETEVSAALINRDLVYDRLSYLRHGVPAK